MDRILYEVATKPGGIDGKDHTDKGQVVFATYDKDQATAKLDPWKELHTRVINTEDAKKKALAKLTPADKLALGIDQ